MPTRAACAKLAGVSTPTLATALHKRGFRNQVVQDMRRLAPGATMVGEAFTRGGGHYIPARGTRARPPPARLW